MTTNDLDRIETRLGVSLPDEYREIMLTPLPSFPSEIVDNAEFVINETVRKRLSEMADLRWPSDYVVIGHSGCGDYYCLDLGQRPVPVVCLNHETQDFEEVAGTFRAWAVRRASG